jgi:hypothetical protein
MPDVKYVSIEAFISVVKNQLSLIHDLTAVTETLKAALMRADALPIAAEYLQALDREARNLPELVAMRKQMERLATDTFGEFLNSFGGTIH